MALSAISYIFVDFLVVKESSPSPLKTNPEPKPSSHHNYLHPSSIGFIKTIPAKKRRGEGEQKRICICTIKKVKGEEGVKYVATFAKHPNLTARGPQELIFRVKMNQSCRIGWLE